VKISGVFPARPRSTIRLFEQLARRSVARPLFISSRRRNALPFILLTPKGSDLMPDNDIEQRIRERVFYIWTEQGQPEGKDREHWQQAESELMAGIAVPQSQVEPAQGQPVQDEPAQHKPASSESVPSESAGMDSAPAAPAVDAIDQIKYAAARDVDQGGTEPSPRQSQSAAQSWYSYQSAAQSWDHYKQRCRRY
jgi:hypothetical protein